MSPRTFKKRVDDLINSLTYTAFQNTRRGLFDVHKLIVASMLTLRIMLREGKLDPSEIDHLVLGKVEMNPPPIPEPLKSFCNENMWAACKGLEKLKPFS